MKEDTHYGMRLLKKLKVLFISFTIVLSVFYCMSFSIGLVSGTTYTDYGTCSNITNFSGYDVSVGNYKGENLATENYMNGTMNSNFVIENSGGPYYQYDYIEYDVFMFTTLGSGTFKVDVGYSYGGQSYKLIKGSGTVTVTVINSTTVQYSIQGAGGTWQIIVDSNQFLAPSSPEIFHVAVSAGLGSGQNTTNGSLGSC